MAPVIDQQVKDADELDSNTQLLWLGYISTHTSVKTIKDQQERGNHVSWELML